MACCLFKKGRNRELALASTKAVCHGYFRHRLDLRVTWKEDVILTLCEGVPFFPRGLDVMEHIHILHLFCRNIYKNEKLCVYMYSLSQEVAA